MIAARSIARSRRATIGIALATLALALATFAVWLAPRVALPIGAAAAVAQAPNWSLIDQAGGVTRAVAWDGRWLYLGVGPRLVVIGRCGDPEPNAVGQSGPMPGIVHDIAVGGDRVWVALGAAGVAAVDVGNPADPRAGPPTRLPGAVADVPGEALALALAGDRLWVAGTAGVHAFDVSRGIARPSGHLIAPAGGFGGAALDIAVDEAGRAYVAWSMHGLRVLEVEDGAIREVGRDPRGDWFAEALDVAGGIAWVAGQGGTLRAIDVTDPARPVERSAVPFTEPEEPMADLSVAVTSDRVFVAGADVGAGNSVVLQELTADPDLPRRISEISNGFGSPVAPEEWLAGSGTALATAWPFAFVAADRYGLAPLRDRSPAAVDAAERAWEAAGWLVAVPPAEAVDAAAAGGGWLAAGSRGPRPFHGFFSAFGVVEAGSPAWFGGALAARDVALVGDGRTALAAADALLWVGPSTGPGDPAAFLATLTARSGLERVAADAGLAVAAGPEGLVVVDVPDDQAPVVRATLPVTDPALGFAVLARDVAIDGAARRAALVDGTWLYLYDLADSAAPRLTATLEVPGSTSGVDLAGDMAWVATEFGGLVGVDIRDAAAPRIASTLAGLEGARAIDVAAGGARAFVALGAAGVAIVRLGDAPAVEAVVDTPGSAEGVAAVDVSEPGDPTPNDGVWVADREGGVVLIADAANATGPRSVPRPTSCPLPPGTLLLPFAARELAAP